MPSTKAKAITEMITTLVDEATSSRLGHTTRFNSA